MTGQPHIAATLTDDQDYRDLQQFLLYVGSGLTAAGEAVNEIQARLRSIASAYGFHHALVAVLPTLVIVAIEPGRPTTIEPTHQLRGPLRLDQTAALFDIVKRAQRGEMKPADGSAEVLDVINSKPRFGWLATIAGHVLLTVGICLILQPTWSDLLLAAVFGALVGILKLVGARWSNLALVMPSLAAFLVAVTTFALADLGWIEPDLSAMIAPLVTFLPGGLLTMGVIEISAGEMVTGATRLVSGALQLILLAFGIVAAAQVVDVPSAAAASDVVHVLGNAAPWLGVLVFGIGVFLYFSGPPGALGWLLLVLATAWISQTIGAEALGGYIGGFVGGLVMTMVAYAVEKRPSGPPALVTFLPGFWLLVPGALGLIGITELIDGSNTAGIQDFLGTIGAMVAIGLGVLCAYPLRDTVDASVGRIRDVIPPLTPKR